MRFISAGVGRADITPPLGTHLMGYAVERIADNVLDQLTVTALAVTDGEQKSILLSITTTVIDNQTTYAIRDAVSKATGYGHYDINVFAWQIHSGAATQTCWGWGNVDKEYCYGILIPGCIHAAQTAIADIGEVEVGVATVQSDVASNRRQLLEDGTITLGQNPWGLYDPTMTAIRFIRNGKPYANIIHYGAHPTAIGPTTDITRDWPGIMVDRVEAIVGGMTLFFNGAVGDIGPRPTNGRTTSDAEGMREVGYRAAYDAVRACNSITQFKPVDMEIVSEDIRIPYRPLDDRETVEKALVAAERDRAPGLKEAEYMYLKAVLAEYENNRVVRECTYRQTVTRIGNVALVPFPGEPFAEIVLRLRYHSPIQNTLSISTANGSYGYMVTSDSYVRGGYEVDVAKAFSPYLLAKNTDDVLVAENLRLLRKLEA